MYVIIDVLMAVKNYEKSTHDNSYSNHILCSFRGHVAPFLFYALQQLRFFKTPIEITKILHTTSTYFAENQFGSTTTRRPSLETYPPDRFQSESLFFSREWSILNGKHIAFKLKIPNPVSAVQELNPTQEFRHFSFLSLRNRVSDSKNELNNTIHIITYTRTRITYTCRARCARGICF